MLQLKGSIDWLSGVAGIGGRVWGKQKAKRNKLQRDRSGRPSRADVLDKEHTSKLTKFWNFTFGSSEDTSSIVISPPLAAIGGAADSAAGSGSAGV